jgi:hypothetical protein
MKRFTPLLFLSIALILSGCVTSHPQTAQEFREAVPGAFLAEVETFVVDRPFSDVAATFERQAPQCLNKRIKTTSQTNMSYQVIVTAYRPTVLMLEDRVELHLQQHHEQGVMNVTEEPEGGYFLIVTDAYPASGGKTQVDLYRPSVGYGVIIDAIKGWAEDGNVGCPDLTKI